LRRLPPQQHPLAEPSQIIPRFLRRLAAVLLPAVLAGCATPPPASDPDALAEFRQRNDPAEPTNRVIYVIDDKLDHAILKPVARAYHAVLPTPVRDSVHNVLANLGSPVLLANDMLEGKPRRAGDTAMRFLINSTLGVAGLFDVASKWGYPKHDADAGMTLALWGVPAGPFIYLPLLGPSGVRDTAGYALNVAADPFIWVGQGTTVVALRATRIVVRGIDERDRNSDTIDKTKATALDPYAAFRGLYQQHRQYEINQTRDDRAGTIPVWFPWPVGQTGR
jgi:phospholipid-binding lipoprotein MlaA